MPRRIEFAAISTSLGMVSKPLSQGLTDNEAHVHPALEGHHPQLFFQTNGDYGAHLNRLTWYFYLVFCHEGKSPCYLLRMSITIDHMNRISNYLIRFVAVTGLGLASAVAVQASSSATTGCTTSKVAVTHLVHVRVHRVIHGKKVMRTITRRVDVKVKKRERIREHGKWVHVVREVVEYRTVTTCPLIVPATTTTTVPAPQTPPAPVLSVHLDPSFTQDASNPLRVTYAYSASASINGVTQTLLPAGVLEMFSDGSLACSTGVGGSATGGNCTVTYSTFGTHYVNTVYDSGTNSSTTGNEAVTVSQYSTTTSIGNASVTGGTIISNDYYATVSIPVAIGLQGAPTTGAVTISPDPLLTSNQTCTAVVNGVSTCTVYALQSSSPQSYTPTIHFSGDTNYSSSGAIGGVITIPTMPAPQQTHVSTTTAFSYTDLGASGNPGFTRLNATVTPSDSSDLNNGTVTFTWTGQDGAESTTASVVGGMAYSSPVSNPTLYPSGTVVTVTYNGGTQMTGDAYETIYGSSIGSGPFN